MEQQNPPIPPSQGNQLIANWTTKPTGLLTAIASQKCRVQRVEPGGFCSKMMGDLINFVTLPAPTLDFLCRYQMFRLTGNPITKSTGLLTAIASQKCRVQRVEPGGFCSKMMGDLINFVTLPAPTLDFLCRYQMFRLTGNPITKSTGLLTAIAP
jgi:hypothetical protein